MKFFKFNEIKTKCVGFDYKQPIKDTQVKFKVFSLCPLEKIFKKK